MNVKSFIFGGLSTVCLIFLINQAINLTDRVKYDCYSETDDGFLDIMIDENNYDFVLKDKKLDNCSSIYISGSKLTDGEIDKLLSKCDVKKLKKLYIYEGNLSTGIAKNISKFQNLESIILEFNHEKTPLIPDEFFAELGKLKYCRIKFCQNDKLPSSLCELKNLEELDISDSNRLTNLHRIGKLLNLKNLEITNACIVELPAEIANLTNLETLSIRSSFLKKLPAELFSLSNLKRLDLNSNLLPSLNGGIQNLNNLEYINISGNAIRQLPSEIGKLAKLKELYANRCYLTEIPEEIGNLKNLEILSTTFNFLHTLPASLDNMANLKHLYITGNEITTVSQKVQNIVQKTIIHGATCD